MIQLKRLNGTVFFLNSDLIEQMESIPDTVITLVSGNNIIVQESPTEVMSRVVEFRHKVAVEKETETASSLLRQYKEL